MNLLEKLFLSIALISLLAACSSGEPTGEDIKNTLMFEGPSFLKINTIEVEASQNIGSDDTPLIKSRFKGTAIVTETLYEEAGFYVGKYVLRESIKKGSEFNIYGISTANSQNDKWRISFESIDIKPTFSGKPITEWPRDGYALEGTPEAIQLIEEHRIREAERQKLLKEKLAKQRAEEEARKQAEQEALLLRQNRFELMLESGKKHTASLNWGNIKYPVEVTFEGYNPETTIFNGRMTYLTLKGSDNSRKLQGTLVDGTLKFKANGIRQSVSSKRSAIRIPDGEYIVSTIDENIGKGALSTQNGNISFEINI